MSLEADQLIDRRRLKRRLAYWRVFGIVAVLALVIAVAGQVSPWVGRDYVASLNVEGVILDDRARDAAIRSVAEDDGARALVVYIDSPGGSVVGGETLFLGLRAVAENKPVVALMGDVATSAGYMAALGADQVYARTGSLTGSIGVILQSADVTGLLEKLGIKPESVKSAPLKAQPNPMEPFSPQARQATREVVLDVFEQFVDLVAKNITVRQITDTDGASGHLVFIGRADAAPGGADFGFAKGFFAGVIQIAVQGQDQRRVIGNTQVFGRYIDALFLNFGDFVQQGPRVEHDTVADNRQLSAAHDAGRKHAQLIGDAVDNQSMPGIVSALKTDHHIGAFRKPVDNFSFSFVAPLRADDHYVGHIFPYSPCPAPDVGTNPAFSTGSEPMSTHEAANNDVAAASGDGHYLKKEPSGHRTHQCKHQIPGKDGPANQGENGHGRRNAGHATGDHEGQRRPLGHAHLHKTGNQGNGGVPIEISGHTGDDGKRNGPHIGIAQPAADQRCRHVGEHQAFNGEGKRQPFKEKPAGCPCGLGKEPVAPCIGPKNPLG